MRRLLLPLLFLSACAGPRTHLITAERWQDDPASLAVVENTLSTRADAVCNGAWSLVSKDELKEPAYKEIRWTVACRD